MTDIGTGTYTILTQIAAEAMEMPVERVTVLMGDTNYPPTDGSGGSFGAATSGAAVLAACQKLKAGIASGMTQAEGSVTPAELNKSYSHAGFGAHFVEAAVHRDTGEVRVRRMLGVFAAGRILNPKAARSQMIGGMTWGIGSALTEENIVDQRYGSFINQDLASYHVAVNADVRRMDVVFLHEDGMFAGSLPSRSKGAHVNVVTHRMSATVHSIDQTLSTEVTLHASAAVAVQIAELETRIAEVRADRDAWRASCFRLMDLIKQQQDATAWKALRE